MVAELDALDDDIGPREGSPQAHRIPGECLDQPDLASPKVALRIAGGDGHFVPAPLQEIPHHFPADEAGAACHHDAHGLSPFEPVIRPGRRPVQELRAACGIG
jgi:hypothetical protein